MHTHTHVGNSHHATCVQCVKRGGFPTCDSARTFKANLHRSKLEGRATNMFDLIPIF